MTIQLLALSGSLRKASYNTAAIKALKKLASSEIDIEIGSIAELPLFNPDRESEEISSLQYLKGALKSADGLIISSPEYAHGISGPLKNALDWLVSGEEFPFKPIMLINTSPRASHAQESLREVLRTMTGNIIEEATVSIPLLGSGLSAPEIAQDPMLSSLILSGLDVFVQAILTNDTTNFDMT